MTNLNSISGLDELDLSYLTFVTNMIGNIHDNVNLSYNKINDIEDLLGVEMLGSELDLSYNNLTYDDFYIGDEFILTPLYSLNVNLIGNPIHELPLSLAYMCRRNALFRISPTSDDIDQEADNLLKDLNAYRDYEW